jgi:hypothetical protein
MGARKVTVAVELSVEGVLTARGMVVAVAIPAAMRVGPS